MRLHSIERVRPEGGAPSAEAEEVEEEAEEAKQAGANDCPLGWEAVAHRLVRLDAAIEFDIHFGLVERFLYRVDGNRCYTPNLGKFQFKDLHFKAQVRRLAAAAECGSREIAVAALERPAEGELLRCRWLSMRCR